MCFNSVVVFLYGETEDIVLPSILKQFAERLKYLRTEKKLTQEQLASRCKLATGFISDLERVKKIPSLVTLDRLAHGFNIEVSELLRFSDKQRTDRDSDELMLLMQLIQETPDTELRKLRKIAESFLSK